MSRPDANGKLSIVPSGAQGYTEAEKRVLEYTSKINEHIFVPFMNVDLNERFVYTIPFTDRVKNKSRKMKFGNQ